MPSLLPLLPELLAVSLSSREHYRRVGLLPHAAPTTILELLEPAEEISVTWGGLHDPPRLRRFLLAHSTSESLSEQVGLYAAVAESACDSEASTDPTARAA